MDSENHASVLISKDNGVSWNAVYGISGFYDIVDIAYNNGYLYITNLEGSKSNPVIHESSIENWNWSFVVSLPKDESNYPSIARLKFFGNNIYALTDTHLFEINNLADTTLLTNTIINEMHIINTFEISSGGKLLIGSDHGSEYGRRGVFYRELNVP